MAEKVKTKKVNDNKKNDAKSHGLVSSGKKLLKGAFIVGGAAIGIGYVKESVLGNKELVVDTENGFSVGYKEKEGYVDASSAAGNTSIKTKEELDRAYQNMQIRDMFTMNDLHGEPPVSNKSTEELDTMIMGSDTEISIENDDLP